MSAVYAHALEVGANGTFDLHEQIFAADAFVATADTDARLKTLKQRKHTRELCVESSRPGADVEFDFTRARLFTSAEHLVASAAIGTSNVQDLQGLAEQFIFDSLE